MKNNIETTTSCSYDSHFLKDALRSRLNYLDVIKRKAERSLKKAPEGSLRISCDKGRIQYYHRFRAEDKHGRFIKAEDRKTAIALAKKDYCQKMIRSADSEEKAIRYYLKHSPAVCVEDVYQNLSEARKDLVLPLIETDDMFLERWKSRFFVGNDYPIENTGLVTDLGETVRSKSELIIANMLNSEGIPYHYECPVYLEDGRTMYPDFTVLNLAERKEYLWEHFGLMDDPEYANGAVQKLLSYEANGYYPGENMILTFETSDCPLNSSLIRSLIERYLK